jgi:hypothetical protein
MFCPKCGQSQASDQIRFCSLCGTNLGEIAKVIAREPNDSSPRDESLTKRFLSLALYVCVAILAVTGWGPWSGPQGAQIRTLAIVLSLVTFVLLFSRPLKEGICKRRPQSSKQGVAESIRSDTDAHALPPARSIPVNRRRVQTAEMVPLSVTEHTTTLLDKN